MSEPLLEIKDLSIDFTSGKEIIHALKNISFQIMPGETIAIVGESGSGKTVTSLSILKLLPKSARIVSGQITFSPASEKKSDLLSLSDEAIRPIRGDRISMIFQEPMTSLNPVKRCGNQVKEAILLHNKISEKEATEQVIQLFKKVRLPDPASIIRRYPHQLSGGQKQRVMIAMAISCNPSLLIADEPTTALDVTVQKAILRLIKDLQEETGMSVMYITHDLGLVAEIADKVVVMYKGEVMEAGQLKEIFEHPKNNYTKGLLNCRPKPEWKGTRLPVIKDFMEPDGTKIPEVKPRDEKQKEHRKVFSGNEILLSVKDLVVSFPVKKNIFGKTLKAFNAVDQVSFDVFQGETLGLVGESGCGKTTLGRALLRLIPTSSGSIHFNDQDILSLSEDEMRRMRRDIQIVFQDPYGSLNPRMTIGQAIREPLTVHGMLGNERRRKERVEELLEKVDLNPSFFNRYPHEFSGGQRQRICIARALAINPDFIICDESVSALDVSVQAQVLNLLSDLRKELGFTCIFISHDLRVVHYISDRIMVMNKGRIEETGTADEVFYHPGKSYTQELIAAIPGRKAGI